MFFRQLDNTEAQDFRQWARDNYVPFSPISGTYHPVVQEECIRINREQSVITFDDKEFPVGEGG